MPDRLESRQVSCPANTAQSAAVEILLNFSGGVVRYVRVVIPSGHNFLTGIALGFGHNIVIPATAGEFIVANGETIGFSFSDTTPGVPWSAFVYNTSGAVQTWQIRFEYDEIRRTLARKPTRPLSAADIVQAGTQLLADD